MEFFTIMVNNGRPRTLPSSTQLCEAQREISDGPCFDLAEVQRLVREKGHKCINVITQNCHDELASYYMDAVDLQELVGELKPRNYHNSLWCKASTKSPWFATDAYRIIRVEQNPTQKITVRYKYYLKFAVNPLNELLLFFSVHRDLK